MGKVYEPEVLDGYTEYEIKPAIIAEYDVCDDWVKHLNGHAGVTFAYNAAPADLLIGMLYKFACRGHQVSQEQAIEFINLLLNSVKVKGETLRAYFCKNQNMQEVIEAYEREVKSHSEEDYDVVNHSFYYGARTSSYGEMQLISILMTAIRPRNGYVNVISQAWELFHLSDLPRCNGKQQLARIIRTLMPFEKVWPIVFSRIKDNLPKKELVNEMGDDSWYREG